MGRLVRRLLPAPWVVMAKFPKKMIRFLFLILSTLSLSTGALAQSGARILVGPNVYVSRERGGNLGELLIASDPTNSKNLLGGGIYTRTDHPQGGQETRGYVSHDGGYSWNNLVFPELAARRGGDPIVGYGRTGTGYFVSNNIDPRGNPILLFYRSEDGGTTWGKPANLTFMDHEQIVVDRTNGPYAGRIYLSGLFQAHPNRTLEGTFDAHIGIYTSSDDGRSWLGIADVANNHQWPARGVQAMNISLFSDGALFVPFIDFPLGTRPGRPTNVDEAKGPEWTNRYWFMTSKDGGATFSLPRKLALEEGGEIAGPFYHFPFFAIDNSDRQFRDRVYAVWVDPAFDAQSQLNLPTPNEGRLLVSYSSNRGKTWSAPVAIKIVIDGGETILNQPLQSMAVSKDGTVAVSWYDTRNTKAGQKDIVWDRYVTVSVDGGQSFLPPVKVSSVGTNRAGIFSKNLVGAVASNNLVRLVSGTDGLGEYSGLTADADGTFHEFWTDGRTGTYQIWTAAIHVEPLNRTNSSTNTDRPDLVETDISDRVTAWLEPLREFPLAGSAELPICLKNVSKAPIYGPIKVEVVSISGSPKLEGGRVIQLPLEGMILNAENGKSGIGALFDYSSALRDLAFLPPGAITEGVVWRFRTPANANEFPRLKLRITARIRRPQKPIPAKPASAEK